LSDVSSIYSSCRKAVGALASSLPNSLGITQFPFVRPAPLGILSASQAFHLFSCS
jgi:hypothetical protein